MTVPKSSETGSAGTLSWNHRAQGISPAEFVWKLGTSNSNGLSYHLLPLFHGYLGVYRIPYFQTYTKHISLFTKFTRAWQPEFTASLVAVSGTLRSLNIAMEAMAHV